MHVTIPEAARLLRVSEHTIRRRLRTGELQGSQEASPGGFSWTVELPDGVAVDNPPSGEVAAMRESLRILSEEVDSLKGQLDKKDRQIEQLHVLLQQSQAALPAPRDRPWWKWWRSG